MPKTNSIQRTKQQARPASGQRAAARTKANSYLKGRTKPRGAVQSNRHLSLSH